MIRTVRIRRWSVLAPSIVTDSAYDIAYHVATRHSVEPYPLLLHAGLIKRLAVVCSVDGQPRFEARKMCTRDLLNVDHLRTHTRIVC